MPRPKGSKNKTKVIDGVDYTAQIAEKNTAAEIVAKEIEELGDKIGALNAERKAKEAELRTLNKEIAKLTKKKETADAKIAEEAKKAEAENLVKKLLAEGMSVDEIVDALK